MFADAGLYADHKEGTISFKPDGDVDAHLGDFLSRPVLIDSFSWPEGNTTLVQKQFFPWLLYFNTNSVRKKLDNYARLRCKLHLKFVVNASPFYYGALRVCYCPVDGTFRDVTEGQELDRMKFSQMPGEFIYPQDMTSFEMELPFLNPDTWLDTVDTEEFTRMGRITYLLYTTLFSANGTVSSNVNISCYAWASEVELAGLTSGLAIQSDEYEKPGVISGPATAIANVAAKLNDAPVIGPFARATEIGARAVGGIASLFGYSNPPVINDVMPYMPKAFHGLASVETGVPLDKLSIDPKNEVTVDKSVTGAKAEDELVITHFCGRQCFLTRTPMDESYAVGRQLLRIPVTPRNYRSIANTNGNKIQNTPAAHVASMFSLWRGSMVYTFKFIKSRYQTGRVQISWDPNTVPLTNAETTTMTRIVDLQYETEVEFMIPYKASRPWLRTTGYPTNWSVAQDGTVTYDSQAHNGIIRVTVLNELTGPAASQFIDILVFAKGGPDLEFSVPNEVPRWSFLNVQSEEKVEQLVDISTTERPITNNAVTVGETIVSLRPLLHRANFHHRSLLGNPYSADNVFFVDGLKNLVNYIPRFPVGWGFTPDGVNYATQLLAPNGKTQFQFSPNTTINWLANCFVGYRGGIVHHFNIIKNGQVLVDSLTAERDPRTHILDTPPRQAINRFTVDVATSQASQLSRVPTTTQLGVLRGAWGHRGLALTNTNTQSAISVITPQYSRWKFRPAYVGTRDTWNGANEKESVRVTATMRCGMNNTTTDNGWPVLETYVAGAVDFDLIYFVCVPTMFEYDTPTADNTF